LPGAHLRSSKSRSSRTKLVLIDVLHPVMCECDYAGCHKAFQRRGHHLKKHKQTVTPNNSHGEVLTNDFFYEFCRNSHFNRQDNLYRHLKWHARLNGSTRGVHFIPAAAPVIDQH
ncbi:hypothetical protein IWW34DRAFT_636267, partial [Fusarium oxysporum f. sp. albedinis]